MSDIDRFLDKIGEIESHNGKYTNHRVMTSGIHQGMHAIGKWGLMPLTVQEISRGSADPSVKALAQRDPSEYNDIINNDPVLEKKIATELGSKVLARQGGDELKAAYAWNNGHNLSPEQIPDEKLLGSPYVHKYFQLAGQSGSPQKNLAQVPDSSMNPEQTPSSQEESPTLDKIMEAYKALQEEAPEEIDLHKSLDNSDEPNKDNDSDEKDNEDMKDPKIIALNKMRGYADGGEVAPDTDEYGNPKETPDVGPDIKQNTPEVPTFQQSPSTTMHDYAQKTMQDAKQGIMEPYAEQMGMAGLGSIENAGSKLAPEVEEAYINLRKAQINANKVEQLKKAGIPIPLGEDENTINQLHDQLRNKEVHNYKIDELNKNGIQIPPDADKTIIENLYSNMRQKQVHDYKLNEIKGRGLTPMDQSENSINSIHDEFRQGDLNNYKLEELKKSGYNPSLINDNNINQLYDQLRNQQVNSHKLQTVKNLMNKKSSE